MDKKSGLILTLMLIFFLSSSVDCRREFGLLENFMRIQRVSYRRRHDAAHQEKYMERMEKAFNGVKDPLNEHKPTKYIKVPDETKAQLLWDYQRPFIGGEIFFIMLLPLIVGKVMGRILASYRPTVNKARKQYSEHPQIPLIYLQGTKEELHIKGPKKNELSWLCTEFLVRGDEKDIVNNFLHWSLCTPRRQLDDDRWKLVRILGKMRIWHHQASKRLAEGKPFDTSIHLETRSPEKKGSKTSYYDEY